MGHIHIKRQGAKSTSNTTPYTDLGDHTKTNLECYVTNDPNVTHEGKLCSDLCALFSIISNKGNRYIYVMYLYDFNSILTAPMNNSSDK